MDITENIFHLSSLPDKASIEEIAIELGVDPAFIEKDWYAVKVIQSIAGLSHQNITPVFSGGTSLSKGFGLLKRFSEDLDFRVRFDNGLNPSRPERRAFRENIFNAVRSIEGITLDESQMDAGSNYFKIPLTYPQQLQVPGALRPGLQLEFSYTQPRREAELRLISSFVAEFSASSPETEILCLTPLETASDKMSALIWRVIKRNRKDENDDPAMIRHLHDLCKLSGEIQGSEAIFIEMSLSVFAEDMQTERRQLNIKLQQAGTDALEILRNDKEYVNEYQKFVANVSYADEDENIEFEDVLNQFEVLIGMF